MCNNVGGPPKPTNSRSVITTSALTSAAARGNPRASQIVPDPTDTFITRVDTPDAAGAMSQRSARLLIALIAMGCIGWLVLQQNVRVLVPLTLLGLAWGSSILPGASAAFIGKFALIAAVAMTGGLILVSPRSGDH